MASLRVSGFRNTPKLVRIPSDGSVGCHPRMGLPHKMVNGELQLVYTLLEYLYSYKPARFMRIDSGSQDHRGI